MFEEMYGKYLEELDQDAAKYMDALKSLQLVQAELHKSVDLANALNAKYGDKYGYNLSTVAKNYSKEEIAQIKAELLDKSLFTLIKRFFGFGKKTDEIYAELMNKLSGLIKYLKEEVNSQTEALRACTETIKNFAGIIDANINAVNKGSEGGEGQYLKIGEVNDHIMAEDAALNVIQNALGEHMDGNEISLPYAKNMSDPVHFVVIYKGEQGRENANSFTRDILYQLIRNTNNYEREFHFFDAGNTGSEFGELISLQKIRENNVWELNSAVTDGIYHFAKVYFRNDDIRNGLRELDNFISSTANEISGFDSVSSFNTSKEGKTKGKIPSQVIVIQNFPQGFQSEEDYMLLSKLIINGKQRGISVIVQCEFSNVKIFEKEIRGRLNNSIKNREDLIDTITIDDKYSQLIAGDCSSGITLVAKIDGEREWIDALVAEKTKIKKVDNKFSSIYGDDYLIGKDTCIDGLEIPFALDRRGNIKTLLLGNTTQTHGLISGTIGAGKTALLHNLMLSASIKYSPEELEIWLVDYKIQDFNTYKLNAPPNMKFVGLSKTEDFTFAFLDKIWDEYLRRTKVIVQANDRLAKEGKHIFVNNYVSYRKYVGNLTRLLVVIDEFHFMSQQIADNESFRLKLENLIAEGRSAGITIVLSDQSVTVGLKGLTEKARKQINCRLALKNDIDELKEMLRTPDREEVKPFENMNVGDCVLVTQEPYRDKNGDIRQKTVREKVKVIHYSGIDVPNICRKLQEYYGVRGYAPEYVDEDEKTVFDEKKILEQEEKEGTDKTRVIPVYLGKSLNLTGLLSLQLINRRQENVMCVGGDNVDQIRMIDSAIRSFQRIKGHRVYIMADTYSQLLSQYRAELQELCRDESTVLVDQPEEICETINYLLADMRNLRKTWNTLIVWIGLDDIYSDFSNYSVRKPEKYKEIANGRSSKIEQEKEGSLNENLSDITNKFNNLFGEEFAIAVDNSDEGDGIIEDEEKLYNAAEDIVSLFKEGSRRGIFNFVLYDSVFPLREIREFKPEYFKHKLAFAIGKDDCLTYLGRSNLLDSLRNGLGVYFDGRNAVKFEPFVLE